MHSTPPCATAALDHAAHPAGDRLPRPIADRGGGASSLPGADGSVDGRPDATGTIAEEILVVAVVAAAWFAIGAGAALALAGREAAIIDMAVSLAVAAAGTIGTLALLARVSTHEG